MDDKDNVSQMRGGSSAAEERVGGDGDLGPRGDKCLPPELQPPNLLVTLFLQSLVWTEWKFPTYTH